MKISVKNEMRLFFSKTLTYSRQIIEFCGNHPFATGLFALLGLIGLLISIVGYEKDRAESKSTTIQITHMEDKIDTIQSHIAGNKDDLEIAGRWNPEIATGLAKNKIRESSEAYASRKKTCDADTGGYEVGCDTVIREVGTYNLAYHDKESIVLVYGISQGECHVCGVTVSIFEFEKKPEGWDLVLQDIDVIHTGTWGLLLPNSVNVYPIGNNIFGIFIDNGYGSQGAAMFFKSIYVKIADEYKEVLDICTRYSYNNFIEENGELVESTDLVETTLDVIPSNTGFHDLKLTVKGEMLDENLEGSVLLAYNGMQYMPKDVDPSSVEELLYYCR